MKLIGIVGYSRSGKTDLTLRLLKELLSRGKKVAVIKHGGKATQTEGKDTTKFSDLGVPTFYFSDVEALAFWKGKFVLEDLLSYINAEIVLVESYSSGDTYPRIICVDSEENPIKFFNGLEIAQYGEKGEKGYKETNIPLISDIKELCDIIENKAFKLPALNCAECDYPTCYEMAKAILEGKNKIEDCTSLYSDVIAWIDGEKIPMKGFVQDALRGTIEGFLNSLKGGNKKGKIKIEIG